MQKEGFLLALFVTQLRTEYSECELYLLDNINDIQELQWEIKNFHQKLGPG